MNVERAPNLSIEELDRESFFHPKTNLATHARIGPTVITGGNGVVVRDRAGREYIDAMAGLCCVNIGWGRREVAEAAHRQMTELCYYHSFTSMGNEASIHLAHRLTGIAPGPMSKVFFGSSGSDANDTLVKFV